jgi:hypothetical protein
MKISDALEIVLELARQNALDATVTDPDLKDERARQQRALRVVDEKLREENARLRERVAKLEEQLKRPPKTPKNSSGLPSAGRKANRLRSSSSASVVRRGDTRAPAVAAARRM